VAGRYRQVLAFMGLSLIVFVISYLAVGDKFWAGLNLSEPVPNDTAIKTEPQTSDEHMERVYVLTQVKYKGCTHVQDLDRELIVVEDFNAPDDFLMLYPEFEVYSASDTEVVLIRYEDGLCPDKSRHVYIGIHDGKIALYLGPPEAGNLTDETEIYIRNLPRTEIEALTRGIQTGSRQEVLEILEGLSSLTPF
jgi:hypothetical protein